MTELDEEMLHNGETRRKAAAWDWVVRIGSVGVWPMALAFGAYVIKHDDSHHEILNFMTANDRFTVMDGVKLENRLKAYIEDRYPNNIRYDYLVDQIKSLQNDVKELSNYVKEQHK